MKLFSKIGLRLILAVGLAAVIIIGITYYFNVQYQTKAMLEEVERHSNQLSETIKKSTRYGMLLNQRDHVHNIINTVGDEESIRSVRVYNKVGEIIYSADQNEIGGMVDKNEQSCFACHVKDEPLQRLESEERTRIFQVHSDSSRTMGIINPIYNEPSCYEAPCHAHSSDQTVLGVLDITICLEKVDEQIYETKAELTASAIIAIIVISILIVYLVRKWVGKPVKDLVEATKVVASGNLNYKIKEYGNNEIGELAKSFNNMTKKLADARMQLFQSDKMASLGRLAAGVAHEINNPLTGVLTYSSFLMKRKQNDPETVEDLKVIVRETKRSREIVKSLLDFARQSVPKKAPADINEIIQRAEKVIENQLTIKGVKIEKRLDDKIPQVTADFNQIQQVLINLIVNGADAIEHDNGKIVIRTGMINLSPYGIESIKKAECPKGHSLMDNQVRIGGLDSIKLKIKAKGEEGILNLDPVYGRNENQFGIPVNNGDDLDVSCPVCSTSLMEKDKKCDGTGNVFFFYIPGQGKFEGCARKGVNWQRWDYMEQLGEQRYVQIIVEDNGSGISKENLARIFEPFFSTKGQKGTGLGLAVIWGIIDNHGGNIKVESEEGKGTKFIIRLPLDKKQ